MTTDEKGRPMTYWGGLYADTRSHEAHPVSGCLEVARNQRFCAGAEAAAAEILELRKALAESRAELANCKAFSTEAVGDLLAIKLQRDEARLALTAATERARWRKVSEGLPTDDRYVLVMSRHLDGPQVGWWDTNDSTWCNIHGFQIHDVTDWMPLPALPSEAKE